MSAEGSPKIIRLPLGAFLGHSRVSKAAVGFSLSGKNFLKAIFLVPVGSSGLWLASLRCWGSSSVC